MPGCWSTRSSAPAFRPGSIAAPVRPHPAGRAFLALLACACEKLSARRFAEYLSLAQVPRRPTRRASPAFIAPDDELLGPAAERGDDRE